MKTPPRPFQIFIYILMPDPERPRPVYNIFEYPNTNPRRWGAGCVFLRICYREGIAVTATLIGVASRIAEVSPACYYAERAMSMVSAGEPTETKGGVG